MNELLKIAVKAVDEKKGEDIQILDFRTISPLTDYFVITNVNNNRLLKAVMENVVEKIEAAGYPVKAIEGNEDSGWLLVDAYDVIIHIFMGEQRRFYALEKLWSDIPQIAVNEII